MWLMRDFFFFFGRAAGHVGSYLPDQGSNFHPVQFLAQS